MARRPVTIDPEAVIAGITRDRGDEVSAALLDAALDLMAAYGVRRWSLDDVAERSGLGRATLYRRFHGRDDLVHAALARDARRFFSAVAEAVAEVEGVEAKLVEGFLVGLRAARSSVLARLVETDPAALVGVLTAEPVLKVARQALVEQYLALVAEPDLGAPGAPDLGAPGGPKPAGKAGNHRLAGGVAPADRAAAARDAEPAELVAEAVVRLAISFVLTPGSVIDLADEEASRRALRRLLAGLLGPETAEHSPAIKRGARTPGDRGA